MERRGVISAAMAVAARAFQEDFQLAHRDPRHCHDLEAIRSGARSTGVVDSIEDAKQRVWETLKVLGGIASPAGSILWYVIGVDQTLNEWCQRRGWGGRTGIRHETATGILIGALGVLDAQAQRRTRRAA
jgi:hypothetical protein